MVARKRAHNESYKEYRENLKQEEKALKKRLQGKVLWPGSWGTAKKVHNKAGIPFLTNEAKTVRLFK